MIEHSLHNSDQNAQSTIFVVLMNLYDSKGYNRRILNNWL